MIYVLGAGIRSSQFLIIIYSRENYHISAGGWPGAGRLLVIDKMTVCRLVTGAVFIVIITQAENSEQN